jgi:hypothetical protein
MTRSFMLCIRVIKSKRLRWAGHVSYLDDRRGAHSGLVEKPKGRRALERPRCRWEATIKMDL